MKHAFTLHCEVFMKGFENNPCNLRTIMVPATSTHDFFFSRLFSVSPSPPSLFNHQLQVWDSFLHSSSATHFDYIPRFRCQCDDVRVVAGVTWCTVLHSRFRCPRDEVCAAACVFRHQPALALSVVTCPHLSWPYLLQSISDQNHFF